jgi:hypothetical protein
MTAGSLPCHQRLNSQNSALSTMLMMMQVTRGKYNVVPPRWNMMSPGSRPLPAVTSRLLCRAHLHIRGLYGE